MGRKPKDRRLEILKNNILEKIACEEDPVKLREWLSCYKLVVDILGKEEAAKEKKQAKLAIPK